MFHRIVLVSFHAFLTLLLVCSCDMFEYHPYASDLYGRKNIHEMSVSAVEAMCQGADTICFAFITDSQGSYDEQKLAVDYINNRKDVMFVIHGGDQSDFGLTKEFLWCRDLLDKLHCPYFCLLGNHDCLGNGEDVFDILYGNPSFSFNASFIHFVCLNTIALEYDYSHPVPDFNFLDRDYRCVEEMGDSISNSIILMHAPPFDEQFNDNVAGFFQYTIRRYPGMSDNDRRYSADVSDELKRNTMMNGFCVNGHTHRTETKNLFDDGVLYYSVANMEKRTFLIFTVTRNGYECETIIY